MSRGSRASRPGWVNTLRGVPAACNIRDNDRVEMSLS